MALVSAVERAGQAGATHQTSKKKASASTREVRARPQRKEVSQMNSFAIADSGSWSLGVLIGGPFAGLLIIIGLVAIGLGILMEREASDGWGFIAGGVAWTVAVVGFAASPLGFYPFDADYHQWREVSGTVQQIDKRLIGSDGKMEDKFVVRFNDGGLQFGCDDTRCASVREGDALTLSCKRAWQYTGTDGYDCRFVSTEAAR